MDARFLTSQEWQALSPGLAAALKEAGARPLINSRAHPAARIAALWRGGATIMARGDVIFWPSAPSNLASPGLERAMALLQHELQHVLDYRLGTLTALGYLTCPRNWTYQFRLEEDRLWSELGAEQRASMAERLWLVEQGLAPEHELESLTAVIPWADYVEKPSC